MKSLLFKKIMIIIMIAILLLCSLSNFVNASILMDKEHLYKVQDCPTKLEYYSYVQNKWIDVVCYLTVYEKDGTQYPAYCLNANVAGVGEYGPYDVDVTQLLDREDIWRVISNGYPYKTPQELGVDNVLDAYMITKRAVHAILYDVDVDTQYKSFDEHGAYIVQQIKKLTDIGRYGTQTRADYFLHINLIGDVYKEGNYYVQKCNVTSNTTISDYYITATANLPTDTIITNESGTQTNSFSAGECFFIKMPKASMQNNVSAILSAQGKCKTYPIYYGKTRIPDTQDYALTYDPYEDLVATLQYNLDVNKCGLVINKTDEETNKPISGVTYNLKYEDGTNIGNYTTTDEGKITASGLRPGKVIVTELETQDKYILDTTPVEVDLEYNQVKTLNLTNEHKRGNLKIYKVDKDNHKITLGNVKFDLYSEEFQKVIGSYATNEDGEIEINNLRVGNYKLIETKTGKWYNLAEDTQVQVKWNTTEENTIENELKKGQIKVIKVDKDNHEVKLAGVKFDVLDEQGNVLETLVTNEDGEALTQKYAIRDYENITLREKETLENYVLSDEPQTITFEENQIKNIVFENEEIKGFLEITKVDSKTKETLQGATFGIYDENDKEVCQITTDEYGIAKTDKLPYGKYYAKELDTGSVYYLLNENTYEFEIKTNDETIPLTIENDKTDIEVDVEKEGTIEIKPGEKVNYEFSNIENKSNIYLDNFKWYDYIPTDYIRLENMTTGTWNQDLKYDVYYKTNKSNDYILYKNDLSTKENYYLDFTLIQLEDDEYIVETMFDFGKVETGFKENERPTMECISFDTLENGQTFTNYTKTVGTYYEMTAEKESKWTTITHKPEEPKEQKLPRTGK